MVNMILEGAQKIPYQKKNAAGLSKLDKKLYKIFKSSSQYNGTYGMCVENAISKIFGGTSNYTNFGFNFTGDFKINFDKFLTIEEDGIVYVGLDLTKDWISFTYPTENSVASSICGFYSNTSFHIPQIYSRDKNKLDNLSILLKKDLEDIGKYDEVFTDGIVDEDKSNVLYSISYRYGNKFSNSIEVLERFVDSVVNKEVEKMRLESRKVERESNYFPKLKNKNFAPIVIIDTETNNCWFYGNSWSSSPGSERSSKYQLEDMANQNYVHFNKAMLVSYFNSITNSRGHII